MVADLTAALGFEPALRLSGLLDTLADELGDDLVAVARESLTNVARHAGPARSRSPWPPATDRLTVDVRDDGVGLGSTDRRSGLDNLRRRAERRGGSFDVRAREQAGTWLCWSVPLS